MASFNNYGLDDLILGFERLAEMPEDVIDEMLDVQAQIIIKEQKQSAPRNTGTLADSISDNKTVKSYDGAYKIIYPKGKHHTTGNSKYRKSKKGTRTVTNAEVGFIHEYGAMGRGIPASGWMRKANEKAEGQALKAGQSVLDNYTKNNGF